MTVTGFPIYNNDHHAAVPKIYIKYQFDQLCPLHMCPSVRPGGERRKKGAIAGHARAKRTLILWLNNSAGSTVPNLRAPE